MLLMDRHLGKPPFKGQLAFSDGSHKTQQFRVVEKICAVIPQLGLVKLAVNTLPFGERGDDERAMWSAVDYACETYAREHEEFQHYLEYFPEGRIQFRPGGFVRDAAGILTSQLFL